MVHPVRLFLLLVTLGVLVAGVFYPGLAGPFIFDDRPNIIENTALHVDHLNLEGLLYAAYSFQPGHGSRSLSMLSFALDYWRGGLNPQVFKITNLVVHLLTTFALLGMLRRLLMIAEWPPRRAFFGALVMALLWAVHPLQISSVLYVVQRMQTLSTLFLVLAFWAYLGMRQEQMLGGSGRQHGALTLLFWLLGFAAKEDAILLPLYALVMELTVLRFRAANPFVEAFLRRGYMGVAIVGAAIYLLIVAPHFWSWHAYPGRDFSSWERLLSQGRVLIMYIGQVLWPLPSRLPFYYDDFVVSRGILQPFATLWSWLSIFSLIGWAWCWRFKQPLFSLGVFVFFSGHFMTSNVIGLELAFEHRNHLPLIGAVLAVSDIAIVIWRRLRLPQRWGVAPILMILIALGGVAWSRAQDWGEILPLSERLVEYSPHSERAWLQLAGVYSARSGGRKGSPDLLRAIEISREGVQLTGSLPLLSNILINKTIAGTVSREDWSSYLQRLEEVPMSVQNRNTVLVLLENFERGVAIDKEGLGEAMVIVSRRWSFDSYSYLRFGAFVFNETRVPKRALPFLRNAVKYAEPDDPDIERLMVQLEAVGRKDWVDELKRARPSHGL